MNMANTTEITMQQKYTMADAEEARTWFSDVYKEVNGFRPRGFTDEAVIHWLNTTDIQAAIDMQGEDERRMLELKGFWTPGMPLSAAWDAFYTHLEATHEARWQGKPKPLTPAEEKLKADTELTAAEALDPTLNPRAK
jgi:hypothetical protein